MLGNFRQRCPHVCTYTYCNCEDVSLCEAIKQFRILRPTQNPIATFDTEIIPTTMNITQEEFTGYILDIAEYIGLRRAYDAYMNEHGVNLPETVKQLTYDLFIENPKMFSYKIEYIRLYANELKVKGYVDFLTPAQS